MTTEARMNEPSQIRGRWTIAVDRFPRKPNGDRPVNSTQRAVNEWYAAHPDAWDLVEVVPVPDEQAIERAAEALREKYGRLGVVSRVPVRWQPTLGEIVRDVLAAALEPAE